MKEGPGERGHRGGSVERCRKKYVQQPLHTSMSYKTLVEQVDAARLARRGTAKGCRKAR